MNNLNNIFNEFQHLQDIFLFFKNTIEWKLFLFISRVTIVLKILFYYARTSVAVYDTSSPFIPIIVMVHIVVTLVKTISLTNSGERIIDEVCEVGVTAVKIIIMNLLSARGSIYRRPLRNVTIRLGMTLFTSELCRSFSLHRVLDILRWIENS